MCAEASSDSMRTRMIREHAHQYLRDLRLNGWRHSEVPQHKAGSQTVTIIGKPLLKQTLSVPELILPLSDRVDKPFLLELFHRRDSPLQRDPGSGSQDTSCLVNSRPVCQEDEEQLQALRLKQSCMPSFTLFGRFTASNISDASAQASLQAQTPRRRGRSQCRPAHQSLEVFGFLEQRSA